MPLMTLRSAGQAQEVSCIAKATRGLLNVATKFALALLLSDVRAGDSIGDIIAKFYTRLVLLAAVLLLAIRSSS